MNEVLFRPRHPYAQELTSVLSGGGGDRSVLSVMAGEGAGTNLVARHLAAPRHASVTEPALSYPQGAR